MRLDGGPTVIVHLHGDVAAPPARVRVGARLDRAGIAVLIGFPDRDVPHMADDRELREMTCDPKFRKILVTDGKTEVGQALVRALIEAGADMVWVGHAEPWKKLPGLAALRELSQVTLVPLDLTDGRSVKELAGEIGGRSTSWSTTPRCTAPSASPRATAPRSRAPRWTSTTSACCAWRRSSGR